MKEGWRYMKLGEIATEMYRGSGIRRDQITTNGSPCVRYGEIYTTYNYYFDKCVSHTDESTIAPKKYFEYGDILFAITGESVEEIGKSIAYLGNNKCLAGGDIIVMKHNQNPKYLAYALSTPNAIAQKGFGKTKLKVVHTNAPSLKSVSIPIPPLPEQQRIVSYLDAEFAKIEALKANAEKQLQAAKDLFQAALKELLTPKEGWVEKKLGDVYDVRDGTHDSPKYYEEGYPLVTSKNLRGGYIDMENVKCISKQDYDKINERSKVDVGDVLFAMIGTIGNATLVEKEPEYAIKNVALFKIPKNQSGKFLKYMLDSKKVLDEMHKKAKGTTQSFVSLGFLRNFTISIPNIKTDQDELVERMDVISNKINSIQTNYTETITLCNDLKQALLKKVFE